MLVQTALILWSHPWYIIMGDDDVRLSILSGNICHPRFNCEEGTYCHILFCVLFSCVVHLPLCLELSSFAGTARSLLSQYNPCGILLLLDQFDILLSLFNPQEVYALAEWQAVNGHACFFAGG